MTEQGLTERDYKILTAGFLPEEMGKNSKYDYIKRSAIHRRLRLVDRNWSNDVDTYVQVIGDTVTVWGTLTIKGVSRRNCASKNLVAYASKENGGEHISEAEYARELANTIKKATSSLIFRCAEAFEIGLYMKEKRTPHTLASVLNEGKPEPKPSGPLPANVTTLPTTTPPVTESPAPDAPPPPDPPKHWALNGDGERIKKRMNDLGLTGVEVLAALEPDKVLAKLSDTSLTYENVYRRLDEISAQKITDELERKRQAQPPSQKGDEPFNVPCKDLRAGDLLYGLSGRNGKPARLMYCLGDTEDGVFSEWIVWRQTQYATAERLPFEKTLTFKILRVDDLAAPPDFILAQVEDLKDSHARFSRKSQKATT